MAANAPIIVVGAGAAGMMAAGRAAELGAGVLLLEKMERPGKKILVTGNGGCNLTNSRDLESFIAQFGRNGQFLFWPFHRFFRDDLLALLRRYGMECKTEPEGKIYPSTDNARDVVRVFQRYMADGSVTVMFGESVTGVLHENGRVTGVETTSGRLKAAAVVIAAGGSAHPETGSSGDGFNIARALGHSIAPIRPALVPLIGTYAGEARRMTSASLRNVRVTALQCAAKEIDLSLTRGPDVGRGIAGGTAQFPVVERRTGDAVITSFGLSGPAVLEMSLPIIDALENGPVSVSIELAPDIDIETIKAHLQSTSVDDRPRVLQDVIRGFLPRKQTELFIKMTGVPPETPVSHISAAERDYLAGLMKSLRFDIKGPYSMSTAMVTAGGVCLDEIEPRTMASRLLKGLFLCGEMIDVDAGTGGYNLQAAFSTGYVAGESAASLVLREP